MQERNPSRVTKSLFFVAIDLYFWFFVWNKWHQWRRADHFLDDGATESAGSACFAARGYQAIPYSTLVGASFKLDCWNHTRRPLPFDFRYPVYAWRILEAHHLGRSMVACGIYVVGILVLAKVKARH
jgi:hypothetical protein